MEFSVIHQFIQYGTIGYGQYGYSVTLCMGDNMGKFRMDNSGRRVRSSNLKYSVDTVIAF